MSLITYLSNRRVLISCLLVLAGVATLGPVPGNKAGSSVPLVGAKGISPLVLPPTIAEVIEIDGDCADDPGNPAMDFASLWDGSVNPDDDLRVLVWSGLVPDPSPLSILTQGGSKNRHDFPEWRHKDSNVPDKSDIANAMAAVLLNPSNNHRIIAWAADLYAQDGSAQIGLWLFLDAVSLNPDGTFSGVHTPGNILILLDFKGSRIAQGELWQWQADGTVMDITSGAFNVNSIAVTNTVEVPTCWPYEPKQAPDHPGNYPATSYFEGALDLTALGLDVGSPSLNSFLLATCSSHSIDAVLKDFVLGTFDTQPVVTLPNMCVCESQECVTMCATNIGGVGPFTFSWTLDGEPLPPDDPPAEGCISSVTLCPVPPVGTHQVCCIATGADGCSSQEACATLTVTTPPICAFDEPLMPVKGLLTGYVTGGAPPYRCDADVIGDGWLVDGCTVTDSVFEITYHVEDPHTASRTPAFTATMTDVNDCQSTCEIMSTMCPPGCVLEPAIQVICQGEEAVFCATSPGCGFPPYTYEWTDSDGNPVPPDDPPADGCACSITVGDAGVYTLVITDGLGFDSECEALLVVTDEPPCSSPTSQARPRK